MRKFSLLPFSLALIVAGAASAATLNYTVTLNSSSIAGTTGSVDFALYPGAGADQSLTATVFGFMTAGGSYASAETLTGNAIGGPVTQGKILTLLANTSTQDNDDLESFKFGTAISFMVVFSGPAVTAADGLATSPYEFVFSTYSDVAGTIPVLTTDAGGASAMININPEAVVSAISVSPQASIVATTPEPSALWMICGGLGLLSYMRRFLRAS